MAARLAGLPAGACLSAKALKQADGGGGEEGGDPAGACLSAKALKLLDDGLVAVDGLACGGLPVSEGIETRVAQDLLLHSFHLRGPACQRRH